MQPTLVDLFEMPACPKAYVPPPRLVAPRQSIDLEIDWEAIRTSDDASGVRPIPRAEDDRKDGTEARPPGVSCETWHRARGWCNE